MLYLLFDKLFGNRSMAVTLYGVVEPEPENGQMFKLIFPFAICALAVICVFACIIMCVKSIRKKYKNKEKEDENQKDE